VQDQKLVSEEQALRDQGSGPAISQEGCQPCKQTQDQQEQALHFNQFVHERPQGKEGPTGSSGRSNRQFAMHRVRTTYGVGCIVR
jgi:hypothetical protein